MDNISSNPSVQKLTKEEILQVINHLKELSKSGVSKKDRRYVTLVKVLKTQDLSQFHAGNSASGSNTSPSNTISPSSLTKDTSITSPAIPELTVNNSPIFPNHQSPIFPSSTPSPASVSIPTPSPVVSEATPNLPTHSPVDLTYQQQTPTNIDLSSVSPNQLNPSGIILPLKTSPNSTYGPNISFQPQPHSQTNPNTTTTPSSFIQKNLAPHPNPQSSTLNQQLTPNTSSQSYPIQTRPTNVMGGYPSSSSSDNTNNNPSNITSNTGGPSLISLHNRPPSIPTVPQQNVLFYKHQITQLRAQISVFKRIMSNQPIPPEHIRLCSSGTLPNQLPTQPQPSQPYPHQPHQPQQPPQSYQNQYNEQNRQQYQPQTNIVSQPPPYQLNNNNSGSIPSNIHINRPQIPTPSHQSNHNQQILAQSIVKQNPIPQFDINILLGDREKRIREKFTDKIRSINTSNQVLSINDQLEMEKIKILFPQHRVRANIIQNLRIAIDNKNLAKPRRGKKSRGEKNRKKKQAKLTKEQQFLSAIQNHTKIFKDFHTSQAQKWKKINRQMMTWHANKARREEQQREREEKERLRALRENDEVAYLKLLEKTKNDRLTQLLNQTDDFLNQIGAKVKEAKDIGGNEQQSIQQNIQTKSLNEMTEEEKKQFMAKEEEEAKQSESTKTYYTIAHTIQEEVTEQPEILVGGTLKPYQLRGLQWLISLYNNNLNGVLADEMGLGKTIQTIALLTYLMEKKNCNGPFLIIVPTSVLPNWQNELKIWAPSIVAVAYKGNVSARKAIYSKELSHGNFNCLMTSYDFIIRDKSSLGKIAWEYIIIDEGHRIKNSKSKLSITLAKFYKSKYRLLLTGTPLQNSLPELWSLLNFLLPTIFNSVDNFQNWFSAPFAAAGEKSELTEEETTLIIHRLHKVLRPFLLRRLKQEVESQLPSKVEKVIRCDFSAMQRRLYDAIVDFGHILRNPDTPGKKKQTKGLNNALMELRKVCNHPYLCDPYADYFINEDMVRCGGKFATLDNLLRKMKASGHKVLLFSQMTEVMTILEDLMKLRDYKYLRLDGSTSMDDRARLPAEFNAPNSPYFVFILSTRAAGQGLNLQSADTVVIFDSDWNPQIDLQAQARAHRIGQTKSVRVFRLVTVKSVEETILDKANHKLDVDKKIIQAGMFDNRSSVSERNEYLVCILFKMLIIRFYLFIYIIFIIEKIITRNSRRMYRRSTISKII